MKKDQSIDLQVSPWQVLQDNTIDEHSITKKIKVNLPQNRGRLQKVLRKQKQQKEKMKQILLVFDRSKLQAKQRVQEQKEYSIDKKQSKIGKYRIRLNTINPQQISFIQKQQKLNTCQLNKECQKIKGHQKHQSSRSNRELQKNEIKNSFLSSKNKKYLLIQKGQGEIFAKRQIYPVKSNQKFKSTKHLVLPKIRLCTIQ